MSDRQSIREQVKTQVADQYAGPIFTGRSIDARSSTEFVNVFIQAGDTVDNGIQEQTESSLVIGAHKKQANDDVLDSIGDLIEASIAADITLGGLVSGLVYTGFEYGSDDESGFDQLFIKYNIVY